VTFCVLTAPSGETQAQRLATQIDEEVTAIPNAPLSEHRATIE
jgi:thermostable 8-oxoguanine DNA glycosylase